MYGCNIEIRKPLKELHRLVSYVCLTALVWSIQPHAGLHAEGYFKVTPNIREAYDLIRRLELDSASQQLGQLSKADPRNLLIPYYENYIDVLKILILEDRALFDRLEDRKDERLQLLSSADDGSPWYLLVDAEINLHWAVARLKFEEYFTAAMEINRAFRLLKKNARLYPDFPYTYRTLGLLKAAYGTVPEKYQWILSLISSLEGSVEEGLREMRLAYDRGKRNHDPILQYEAGLLYAFGLLSFDTDTAAVGALSHAMKLKPEQYPIDCFFLAHIFMRMGRNDEAIEVLSRKPARSTALSFHYLDFMLGLAKLYRGDQDADKLLLRYVHQFKGRYYIKEAYQKLAWHALLYQGEERYYQYMRVCKLKGEAITEEDKYAMKEAAKMEAPDPCLLRARLAFDGGYYAKALKTIESCQVPAGKQEAILEYTYRKGRILQALGRHEKALAAYRETIENGSDSGLYFACSAALHAGEIEEKRNNVMSAESYFRKCLSLKPDEYQAGLHQKAKAGLERVRY